MAKKKEENLQPIVHEGLKSLSLEIDNFKNIDKMVIEIGGRSLLIIGKNGAGKSSFIQAMMSPLNSKMLPSEPIKKGEERAKISHKIGGLLNGQYEEYILDMFFTPKDKTGRLVVYNKDNEVVKSPATFVKNLIGNVSFDVTQWLNDTKAKRLETIKKLTGCANDIDMINIEISKLKADKKYKSDRAEELEGSLKNHEFTREEIDTYSNPVDLTPIQTEISNVAGRQQQWDGVKLKVDTFNLDSQRAEKNYRETYSEIERLKALIVTKEVELEGFKNESQKAFANVEKGQEWLNTNPRPSIDDVNQRMNDAIAHNEKHNRIGMLGNQQKEMITLKSQVEDVKSDIEAFEARRSDIISKSQLPIEGLTFSDEDLFIDGLPLESGQINKAREWQVGIQVAMALNPNYKGIFLHDASLFDKETLHSIIHEIEKHGYFAICELVAPEGDDLHVDFVEKVV